MFGFPSVGSWENTCVWPFLNPAPPRAGWGEMPLGQPHVAEERDCLRPASRGAPWSLSLPAEESLVASRFQSHEEVW